MTSAIATRCEQIAARQYGIITRGQALEAGATVRQIERLLSSGRWRRVHPGTYALARVSSSLRQEAMGPVQWAGPTAAASHETACALRRFADSLTHPIEISSPRNLSSELVVVHRVRPWADGEVEVVNGIPVTSVERTLVDMAGRELAPRLKELLDEAFRRSLTSVDSLDTYVRRACGYGRRGPSALRLLLPRYRSGNGLPESILESRVQNLLEQSALPEAVRQYVVLDSGRFVGRVDFAYPEAKVAVEAVGRDPHERQWKRDLARMNALTKCGWIVIYVTWEDVHVRPRETVMTIAQALGIAF